MQNFLPCPKAYSINAFPPAFCWPDAEQDNPFDTDLYYEVIFLETPCLDCTMTCSSTKLQKAINVSWNDVATARLARDTEWIKQSLEDLRAKAMNALGFLRRLPIGSELFGKTGDIFEGSHPWICEMMDAPGFQLMNESLTDNVVYDCTTADRTETWYAHFEEWLLSTGYEEAGNWISEIDDITCKLASAKVTRPHHRVLEFYAFAANTYLERASAAVEEMGKAVIEAMSEAEKQLCSPSRYSETEQDQRMDDSSSDFSIDVYMDIDVFQANPLVALPTFDTPPASPSHIKPLVNIPTFETPPASPFHLSSSRDMMFIKLPGSIDSAFPSNIVEQQHYWNPSFPPRRTVVRVSAVPFGKKKAQKRIQLPLGEASNVAQQAWNEQPRWKTGDVSEDMMTGSSCYSDNSDDGRCCMCLRVYCECP